MTRTTGHPQAAYSSRSDQVLAQAIAALDSGRPTEAENLAGEVLQTNQRHARALYVLGCAWLMQGRAVEAIAPLETAAWPTRCGNRNDAWDRSARGQSA